MWKIWWQDGQGRQCLLDESDLRKAADSFGFCADEVLHFGDVSMFDEYGEEVGGVFKDD